MAILITEGKIIDLDPSYVGRWSGSVAGPGSEPDRCYFCGIGDRPEAVGYLDSTEGAHYGVCKQHKRRRSPDGGRARFVRYPKVTPRIENIPAGEVKKGMAIIVDPYGSGGAHLRTVERVTRQLGHMVRVYLSGGSGIYLSVDREYVFRRIFSRFDK
jgi:hypothetical protein